MNSDDFIMSKLECLNDILKILKEIKKILETQYGVSDAKNK